MTDAETTPLILVADDDDMNRELMDTILQREGYRVLQAANGVRALETATNERP
ncbi:MAG: response regulator, partial [Chloroflexi bacterium]|nr:response regulator [Chloroflexota bacterium]